MAGLRKRQQQLAPSGGAVKRLRIEFDKMIIGILSRLPVKCLIRFRCVCKSWRALISGSHLVRQHLRRAVRGLNPNSYKLLISARPIQYIDLEAVKDVNGHVAIARTWLNFPLKATVDANMKMVGSCNGLICLRENQGGIIFWNPSTAEAKMLPGVTSFRSRQVLFYGFGYDSSIEDYKVILGGKSVTPRGLATTVIAVFTRKSGSWRTVPNLNHVKLNGLGCLLNRVLHWVEFEWRGTTARPVLSSRIISFDLAEEKFQEMLPLSHLTDQTYISIRIGTMKNHLFVYMFNENGISDVAITIWVMKEYGNKESWTKIIQIPSDSLCQFRPHPISYMSPICILENDEVLMSCDSSHLVLYDPKEKTFRFVTRTPVILLAEVTMYVETLVSPVAGSGATI